MPLRGSILVDENLCKACELCVEACPQHVIALDNEKITPRGFHPPILRWMAALGAGSARWSAPKRQSPFTAKNTLFKVLEELMAKELWEGNQAFAEAAVRAGLKAFFGYPITPQTEALEYMSSRMPRARTYVLAG